MKNANKPIHPIYIDERISFIYPSEDYPVGLTKREYMATKILAGIMSDGHDYTRAERVRDAIKLTDELLLQLESNPVK